MISIDWNPMPYLGPVPINWYGITFAFAALTGRWFVIRSSPDRRLNKDSIDRLLLWILAVGGSEKRGHFGAFGAEVSAAFWNEPFSPPRRRSFRTARSGQGRAVVGRGVANP